MTWPWRRSGVLTSRWHTWQNSEYGKQEDSDLRRGGQDRLCVCVFPRAVWWIACVAHTVHNTWQHGTGWSSTTANSCLSESRHIPSHPPIPPSLLLYVCGLTHCSGQNVIVSVCGRDCIRAVWVYMGTYINANGRAVDSRESSALTLHYRLAPTRAAAWRRTRKRVNDNR